MDFANTLFGVIVGGSIALVTGLLLARRAEQHERRKLLLSQLQDLHVAIDVTLSSHITGFTGAMAHLRHGTPHGKVEPAQLEKVHAIVGLYFPEIDAEYAALVEEINAYVPLMLDALLKRPPTEPEQIAACHRLTEVSQRVHRCLRAVQARAVEVARQLVPGKGTVMNGSQRGVLVLASIAAAAIFTIPPWVVRTQTPTSALERLSGGPSNRVTAERIYADILHQPPLAEIDSARLLLQLLALGALTAGALLALGALKRRS